MYHLKYEGQFYSFEIFVCIFNVLVLFPHKVSPVFHAPVKRKKKELHLGGAVVSAQDISKAASSTDFKCFVVVCSSINIMKLCICVFDSDE